MSCRTSQKSSMAHFYLEQLSTAGYRHGLKISRQRLWSAGGRSNRKRARPANRRSGPHKCFPRQTAYDPLLEFRATRTPGLFFEDGYACTGVSEEGRRGSALLAQADSKTSIFCRIRRLATARNRGG